MNYRFYYYPSIELITQNSEEFKFTGFTYRYFSLKLSIYAAQKTRIPAIAFSFILFGLGFEFYSHTSK